MSSDGTGYVLDKQGDGRFELVLNNGLRQGMILGGAGCWVAESGTETLGRYPTRKEAAQAIMARSSKKATAEKSG